MTNTKWAAAALGAALLGWAAWSALAAGGTPANAYDLESSRGLRVSYSASSFGGVPLFHYDDGTRELSFRDDELRTEKTSIGTLITVRLKDTPDLEGIDFTLVVPRVNVDDSREGPVKTFGFWTRQRTTIGGPDLVDGQVESYRTVRLAGTAQYLDF